MSADGIADHGVIGDLQTVALVDTAGTIDFLCVPRLDSATVFASLLDAQAGRFTIEASGETLQRRQMYLADSNVLLTQFVTTDGFVELTDFLAIGLPAEETALVRIVRVIRGRVRLAVACAPHFDYARSGHEARVSEAGVEFVPSAAIPPLRLVANVPLAGADGAATASFTLQRNESRAFVFGRSATLPAGPPDVAPYAEARLAATVAFWQAWCARSTYRGRWREAVMRSALTLKLLVSDLHGSIAAAATFGLPEAATGERNWDYRYSWIRDASFAVYAFIRLGYVDEALAFMGWIGVSVGQMKSPNPMRPMYRLDGSADVPAETILEHFAGYRGARPVRIGNAAHDQLQLDVYGALMDAVYLTSKYGGAMSLDAWAAVSAHINYLCEHWADPDEGIWEVRSGRRPFLHSRVMCWVAVDRATRLAAKRSLPAPLERWNAVRSEIHASILRDFWNADIGAFVRTAGDDQVDASALMLPLVRFITGRDPRWISTQAHIEATLVEDVFVYRYRPGDSDDGVGGHEGAFSTCSFWLVECMVRSGDIERARITFEKLLRYGNHVGLFAEEFGSSGEQLGNFPQALTHLALISAAVALDDALASDRVAAWK